MTDTDEFPIPALDDADRAVIFDALFDGRPEVVAHADRMLAAVGLGPVARVEPQQFDPALLQALRLQGNRVADLHEFRQWAFPLPQNMALHEQPGHPRPARLILAELDSPEGRGAIANEERRRARARLRGPMGAALLWDHESCILNPPYEGSGSYALGEVLENPPHQRKKK